MKGGNSDKVHINGGLLKRVESLIEQHPEHVKYTYRFKKHHFLVNYKPFKNTPYILKDEFNHIEDVDEMYNDWGFIIEDK